MGDGSQWGLRFEYIVQPSPDGLAQAYILAEDFLAGAASAMVLGDNIFFGHGLPQLLNAADARASGGTVFGYRVHDPERYGVVGFDEAGNVREIIEKPPVPPSDYAVTGLYFLDGTAPARARAVKPSARGEIEITTLLESYLHEGSLTVERMGRGFAWLDTGTHGSLLDAGNFVRTLEQRQGLQTGCPEEIAFAQGWIDAEALRDVLAGDPITYYCGFDPTAPSLHLGNLVQLLLMRRLQLAGAHLPASSCRNGFVARSRPSVVTPMWPGCTLVSSGNNPSS